VQVLPGDVLALFRKKSEEFQVRYGETVTYQETRLLRGFLQLMDAVKNCKHSKLDAVAHSLSLMPLLLPSTDKAEELWERIKADPLDFLRLQVSRRASDAQLVLWRARVKDGLMPGILCSGIAEALRVLVLFTIGGGKVKGAGSCVICGKVFVSQRGDRKKTCSDRCRKSASRRNQK
jgi:hypothetical protein